MVNTYQRYVELSLALKYEPISEAVWRAMPLKARMDMMEELREEVRRTPRTQGAAGSDRPQTVVEVIW
jgi:hypothetical protein